MIKSFIKRTELWRRYINSDLYRRYKYPVKYKKYKEEVRFYTNFLKCHPAKNDLIFDVGANKGDKSFIFSKISKKVLAFEPSENLFGVLQQRFYKTNVKPYNYALGSKVSESVFYIVEKNEAYNSLNEKHIKTTVTSRGMATIENVKKKIVKVQKLENLIDDYGIPKYIKIDVEGYEYEVVMGLETPVPLISFEVNLPEFRLESIKTLDCLNQISGNKYLFNFASTTSGFLIKTFVSKEEAQLFIENTQLSYVEIYAYLS